MSGFRLTVLGAILNLVWAAGPASAANATQATKKVPDFSYELRGRRIRLFPPKGHHFNVHAPNEIRFGDKDLTLSESKPGRIEARLHSPHAPGTATATAYVCDEAETYCAKKTRQLEVP